MSDAVTIRRIDFVRAFPWLRCGRAVGCALSIPALVIALIGVLLVDWSQWALARVLPPAMEGRMLDVALRLRVPPIEAVLEPYSNLNNTSWPAWLLIAAAGVVWSFFGVAICRCAAVEFCRDESASFRLSLQHAIRSGTSPGGALVTPLVGAAILAVMIAILALPAFIPGVGGLWLRLLAPVFAVLGTAAGLILLILPVLWPLMIAAIAVDDSDGFDAFSRSFSFVTSHPWITAALIAIAGGMLWLCGEAIERGVAAAEFAIPWAAGWTASDNSLRDSLAPASFWWVRLFARALQASLFWSLATIGYVFLRQVTDGTPLDALSGYDEPALAREDFPVVGIPAMTPPQVAAPPAETAAAE